MQAIFLERADGERTTVAMREMEWKVKYTQAFRLMYIAETLINPLFTDVAFCRDSVGDGSGHYESGGVMSPLSLVPSARLGDSAPKNENSVINYSLSCRSKPVRPWPEHKLRYLLWNLKAFWPSIDSKATTTFKVQKASKNINKIFHVTSVILRSYKNTFCAQRNYMRMSNEWQNCHFWANYTFKARSYIMIAIKK